ncbi:hypothetical protein AGMMS49949_05300 [Alphaproteobacteria bacterium]|nr:hypothetical protein AGMMS49949_05300 [Alphaproteobacteria bacterium]
MAKIESKNTITASKQNTILTSLPILTLLSRSKSKLFKIPSWKKIKGITIIAEPTSATATNLL